MSSTSIPHAAADVEPAADVPRATNHAAETPTPARTFVVLTPSGGRYAVRKSVAVGDAGKVEVTSPSAKYFIPSEISIPCTLDAVLTMLRELGDPDGSYRRSALVMGQLTAEGRRRMEVLQGCERARPKRRHPDDARFRRLKHPEADYPVTLQEGPPSCVLPLDIDTGLPRSDSPDELWQHLQTVLHPSLRATRFLVQFTAGHGFKSGSRVRVWIITDTPLTLAQQRALAAESGADVSIYSAEHLIYTAHPSFVGLDDPMPQCRMMLAGPEDAPAVAAAAVLEPKPNPATASATNHAEQGQGLGLDPALRRILGPDRTGDLIGDPESWLDRLTPEQRQECVREALSALGDGLWHDRGYRSEAEQARLEGLEAELGDSVDLCTRMGAAVHSLGDEGLWQWYVEQAAQGRSDCHDTEQRAPTLTGVGIGSLLWACQHDSLGEHAWDSAPWRKLADTNGTEPVGGFELPGEPPVIVDAALPPALDVNAVMRQGADDAAPALHVCPLPWGYRLAEVMVDGRLRQMVCKEPREAKAQGKSDDRLKPICTPVLLMGRARDEDEPGGTWGEVFCGIDPEGRTRVVSITPGTSVRTVEVAARLAAEGVIRKCGSREFNLFITALVNTMDAPLYYWRRRAGWAASGGEFWLPGHATPIMADPATRPQYVLSAESASGAKFRSCGDLAQWQSAVAALAEGNSRLVFSISLALTGPLLQPCQRSNAGIHWYGKSSSGKTSLAVVAGSVWGGGPGLKSGFAESWRSTTVGVEAAAARHSDMLLVLDEISEADPRAVPQCAYLLMNGSGKLRGRRDGGQADVARFSLTVISTGEFPVDGLSESAGGPRSTAGTGVRILDIPAAGITESVFEDTHGLPPAEFADRIRNAALTCYGVAGREFIRRLLNTDGVAAHREWLERAAASLQRRISRDAGRELTGQEGRVVGHIAFAGAVGELAVKLGVLPWQKGSALQGARVIARDWLAGWSPDGRGADHEDRQLLQRLAAWLPRNTGSLIPIVETAAAGGGHRWMPDESAARPAGGRVFGLRVTYAPTTGPDGTPMPGITEWVLSRAALVDAAGGDAPARRLIKLLSDRSLLARFDAGKNFLTLPTEWKRLSGLGMRGAFVLTNDIWEAD